MDEVKALLVRCMERAIALTVPLMWTYLMAKHGSRHTDF